MASRDNNKKHAKFMFLLFEVHIGGFTFSFPFFFFKVIFMSFNIETRINLLSINIKDKNC